jgi:DNA-binding transcriptional ArsR family regulator
MASNTIDLAEIGALIGDPARAAMLCTLMDGRAQTAGELAYAARVSAPTASEHLRRLTESKLLAVVKQGRHRYFRIATPLVAQMIESMGTVASLQMPPRHRPIRGLDAAMREARLCYDHLAGRLGVVLADALIARGCVMLGDEGGEVTPAGFTFFAELGVELQPLQRGKRAFCRPCLDWSERRFHVAGQTGAALASHCFEQGWIDRMRDGRAVVVTALGREAFADRFGVDLMEHSEAA